MARRHSTLTDHCAYDSTTKNAAKLIHGPHRTSFTCPGSQIARITHSAGFSDNLSRADGSAEEPIGGRNTTFAMFTSSSIGMSSFHHTCRCR